MSGCTAHFVTEQLDQGPVILQDVFHIRVGEDTLDEVKARGQELEGKVLSQAVQLFTSDQLVVKDKKVIFRPGLRARHSGDGARSLADTASRPGIPGRMGNGSAVSIVAPRSVAKVADAEPRATSAGRSNTGSRRRTRSGSSRPASSCSSSTSSRACRPASDAALRATRCTCGRPKHGNWTPDAAATKPAASSTARRQF